MFLFSSTNVFIKCDNVTKSETKVHVIIMFNKMCKFADDLSGPIKHVQRNEERNVEPTSSQIMCIFVILTVTGGRVEDRASRAVHVYVSVASQQLSEHTWLSRNWLLVASWKWHKLYRVINLILWSERRKCPAKGLKFRREISQTVNCVL